jgi:hypothetical protein
MRALLILLALFAAPTYAAERTWTIATTTYAMAAELVEVRGDIAYLKTGERIEPIPLVRLSAADMKYIESLPPSVVLPGPADEQPSVGELPAPANASETLPPSGPILNAPAPAVQQRSLKPAYESPVRQPNSVRAATPYVQREEMLPTPPSARQPRSLVRRAAPRAPNNTNVPRPSTPQTQNRYSSANRNRSQSEERTGLFGRRSRRFGN